MVEAFAILFVVIVAVGAYVSAWVGAQDFSKRNISSELAQLRDYRETLREKTIRGEQEQWDSEMMRQLADRVEDVEQRIAQKMVEAQNPRAA